MEDSSSVVRKPNFLRSDIFVAVAKYEIGRDPFSVLRMKAPHIKNKHLQNSPTYMPDNYL